MSCLFHIRGSGTISTRARSLLGVWRVRAEKPVAEIRIRDLCGVSTQCSTVNDNHISRWIQRDFPEKYNESEPRGLVWQSLLSRSRHWKLRGFPVCRYACAARGGGISGSKAGFRTNNVDLTDSTGSGWALVAVPVCGAVWDCGSRAGSGTQASDERSSHLGSTRTWGPGLLALTPG